ncbi:antA/AntB antirepressor family protein [Sulfurimonas sp. SAG-AH-194-C20]|nr:antA/AntB antirepressor family protein [Sulfurimonas sp. SAG-AH-194-C20]MDF1879687.1 antA/AntB antirepressor family protein [Sulfurimonas sp. SAG-AH-194-C20]
MSNKELEESIRYETLETRLFGNDEVNSVSAKELYKELYTGKDFTSFRDKIVNNFDKDIDYVFADKSADVLVTIDTAKGLAMMAMTPKGNSTRKYFIAVEKKARQLSKLTPLQHMEIANQMLLVENEKKTKEIEFKKKLLQGQETVIRNIADDLDDEEVDMTIWCQLLTSRATDTYMGRTTVYNLLRMMKLVRLKDTAPTQLGTSSGYLKLRHHENGIGTKVLRSKMPQLTRKLIKFLLNNEDVNESLGFPFHPELRTDEV